MQKSSQQSTVSKSIRKSRCEKHNFNEKRAQLKVEKKPQVVALKVAYLSAYLWPRKTCSKLSYEREKGQKIVPKDAQGKSHRLFAILFHLKRRVCCEATRT